MSRLECKDEGRGEAVELEPIRICPDWNVKIKGLTVKDGIPLIRICPDWNVKFSPPILSSRI